MNRLGSSAIVAVSGRRRWRAGCPPAPPRAPRSPPSRGGRSVPSPPSSPRAASRSPAARRGREHRRHPGHRRRRRRLGEPDRVGDGRAQPGDGRRSRCAAPATSGRRSTPGVGGAAGRGLRAGGRPQSRPPTSGTWTADVSALLAGGSTSLLLLPGAAEGGAASGVPAPAERGVADLGRGVAGAADDHAGVAAAAGVDGFRLGGVAARRGAPEPRRGAGAANPGRRRRRPPHHPRPPRHRLRASPSSRRSRRRRRRPATVDRGGESCSTSPVCALVGFGVAYARNAATNGRLRIPLLR